VGKSSHVRKQTAVASLRVGAVAARMFPGEKLDAESFDIKSATKTF